MKSQLIALVIFQIATVHVVNANPDRYSSNSIRNTENRSGTAREYWTPDRLQNAKPIDLPRAEEFADEQIMNMSVNGRSLSAPGRAPTVNISPDNTPLFEPLKSEVQYEDTIGIIPHSYGTDRAYFTSSRVTPAPAAPNSYPFRATGKLFITDTAGNNSTCSAAVIEQRLIITAGHCVYDAQTRRWHKNFAFQPAHHNGTAPYGTWDWSWVITTDAWMSGRNIFPNRGDFALIEMKDRNGRAIGSVTGTYGWRTNALIPNHVTMLGYPGSFDNGSWMHRVDSQFFRAMSPNSVEYGSDMTRGSSGGPWLENFGEQSTGQSISPNGMNYVVGITSYGPIYDMQRRFQGSSILDGQFSNSSRSGIFDKACRNKVGNCSSWR